MNSEELDRFVRDMLADKDLPGLSDDEIREQVITDLKEQLLDQIDRAIVEAIPDDKIDDFNSLLDNEDTSDDSLREYIAQSGVDVDRVTIDTMTRFRDLYLTSPEQRTA